jgi:hypothetical protein
VPVGTMALMAVAASAALALAGALGTRRRP